MRVYDFNGPYEANSIQDLETLLMRRDGHGANGFWLSHESALYPTLSLLVKDDLAYLHYVPKENEAGFRSVGKMASVLPGKMTTFFINKDGDQITVLNDAVLPFSAALRAAKPFFFSTELPQSVQWLQLCMCTSR